MTARIFCWCCHHTHQATYDRILVRRPNARNDHLTVRLKRGLWRAHRGSSLGYTIRSETLVRSLVTSSRHKCPHPPISIVYSGIRLRNKSSKGHCRWDPIYSHNHLQQAGHTQILIHHRLSPDESVRSQSGDPGPHHRGGSHPIKYICQLNSAHDHSGPAEELRTSTGLLLSPHYGRGVSFLFRSLDREAEPDRFTNRYRQRQRNGL